MQRFTLTPSENLMWTVFDADTGFSIKFREGLFNETQEVTSPDTFPEGVPLSSFIPKAMREIGDYMAQEHNFISVCNIKARRNALWILSHENWWKTIVAACNSLVVNWEDDNKVDTLLMEIDDFLKLSGENPAGLEVYEQQNLIGAVSLLSEDEASEVLKLVHIFWNEYVDTDIYVDKWAQDLLWWPCWANTVLDS